MQYPCKNVTQSIILFFFPFFRVQTDSSQADGKSSRKKVTWLLLTPRYHSLAPHDVLSPLRDSDRLSPLIRWYKLTSFLAEIWCSAERAKEVRAAWSDSWHAWGSKTFSFFEQWPWNSCLFCRGTSVCACLNRFYLTMFPLLQSEPLRIFYESLYHQRPDSEMAQIWWVLCARVRMKIY